MRAAVPQHVVGRYQHNSIGLTDAVVHDAGRVVVVRGTDEAPTVRTEVARIRMCRPTQVDDPTAPPDSPFTPVMVLTVAVRATRRRPRCKPSR